MKKKKKHLIRCIVALLLSPLVLVVTAAVLLYVPFIQRWAVRQAVTYVNENTELTIDIEALHLTFPLDLSVESLTVALEQDTLAQASSAIVDLDLSNIFSGQIGVDAIDLHKASVNTQQFIKAVSIRGALNAFHLDAHGIDLKRQHVSLDQARLEGADVWVMLADSTEKDTTESSSPDWNIDLHKISLSDVRVSLRLPKDSTPLKAGIREATLHEGALQLADGTYRIPKFNIAVDSLSYGFMLRDFAIGAESLLIDSVSVGADSLHLTAPHTFIAVSVHLPWSSLSPKEGGHMTVKMQASVGFDDLIQATEGLFPNELTRHLPHQPLIANLDVEGNVDKLLLHQTLLQIPQSIFAQANGEVYNLTQTDSLGADLQLEAHTGNLDWLLRWQKLKDVHLPPMTLTAKTMMKHPRKMLADALLTQPRGRMHLVGNINTERMAYTAQLNVSDWQMHNFLPNDSIYMLDLRARMQGVGTDLLSRYTSMKAQLHVDTLEYAQCQLGGIDLTAQLSKGEGLLDFTSNNEILRMEACADAKTDRRISDAHFSVDLSHIDLHALRLTSKPFAASMVLHMEGESDLKQTHTLTGSAQAIELITDDSTLHPFDLHWHGEVDQDHLLATANAGDLNIHVASSQGLDSLLQKMEVLNRVWTQQMDSMKFAEGEIKRNLPYLDARISSGERNPLSNILRYATGYSTKKIEMYLSTSPQKGLNGEGLITSLNTGAMLLDTIRWDIRHKTNTINLIASVRNNRRNPVGAFSTNFEGKLTANNAAAHVVFIDANGKEGVNLGMESSRGDEGVRLHLTPLNPIIAYRHFSLNPDNFIELAKSGKLAASVNLLADDGTGLKIYTTPNETAKQDISLSINHLNIGELAQTLPYMPNVMGFLQGDVHYMQQDSTLTVSTDLTINDFKYDDYPMGDIGVNAIYMPNADGSLIVDGFLTHNGEEVSTLSAIYSDQNSNASISGDVNITQLPLALAEAFVPNHLLKMDGYLNGSLRLDGSADAPHINGVLATSAMQIHAPEYNVNLTFPDRQFTIVDNLLDIGKVEAYAIGENPLTLTGQVNFMQLDNVSVDARIAASNYQLMNAPRSRNASAWGKAFVDVFTMVKGPLDDLKVRGGLKVLGNTDVSLMMADTPLTVDDQLEELVTFTDFSDTIKVEEIVYERQNIDVQMNIAVDQGTRIHVLLSDDGNDHINLQGGGDMTFTYDMDNSSRLFGRYTIMEGDMRYSIMGIPLNDFKIASNSFVEFNGNITNPHINLKASERVKSSVTEDKVPRYVAFNVGVSITNTLSDLGLLFTIEAPEDLTVQNELTSLSDEERNRVAMTMLVTGMYISGNASSGSGFSYQNTLNSYLQSSINRIVGQAATGIDINLGIENSTTLTGSNTTDYNFSFAKRFWDNRINVVIGGKVSSGKEAVNNGLTLINNVSVEYSLDKSASRYVRLYYDRNHQSLIEGELTEMGAGIVLHRKSNKLGDLFIFRTKKKDEKPTPHKP